jgi:hypothetical protein
MAESLNFATTEGESQPEVMQRIHRLEAEVQRLSDLLALHFDAHGDRTRANEASDPPKGYAPPSAMLATIDHGSDARDAGDIRHSPAFGTKSRSHDC